MSKTPLTDAKVDELDQSASDGEAWCTGMRSHAEKLEQDRAELLAALKAIKPYLVGGEAIIANAAIAKAEGK